MPILRRELAFSSRDLAMNDGNWWHLVLDTEQPGLWVEHSWQHLNTTSGQPQRGSERFGVNDFLTFRDGEDARAALTEVLGTMFPPLR